MTKVAAKPDPQQWVSQYADHLYSFAMVRLDNEEIARDLVQETFLAALERLDQFRRDSTERTWLTAILKYKVIEVYRKRNSGLSADRSKQEAEPEPEFFEMDNGHWKEAYAPRVLGVEDTDPLEGKELMAILRLCLQKLPALWLSVITMKHLDEEETKVICQELKLTAANFWVIIHRAKVNLRACIEKSWL